MTARGNYCSPQSQDEHSAIEREAGNAGKMQQSVKREENGEWLPGQPVPFEIMPEPFGVFSPDMHTHIPGTKQTNTKDAIKSDERIAS